MTFTFPGILLISKSMKKTILLKLAEKPERPYPLQTHLLPLRK
jgi:hypothetical protein